LRFGDGLPLFGDRFLFPYENLLPEAGAEVTEETSFEESKTSVTWEEEISSAIDSRMSSSIMLWFKLLSIFKL
jgi:hypothetical protein